jgi:hypothetical protein
MTAETKAKVGQLNELIERFRTLSDRSLARSMKAVESNFAAFRSSLSVFEEHRTANSKSIAPRFNPLLLLDLQEAEWFHTAVLTELLNPRGSHGQGCLFLKAFLIRCGRTEIARVVEKDSDSVWVDSEVGFHLGRLDIYVSALPRFSAIIENKVKATEGTDQLRRYRRILDLQDTFDTLLVYLTPKGVRSKTRVRRYLPMSYETGISGWLRDCLSNEIKAQKVRDWVEQYLAVVEVVNEI